MAPMPAGGDERLLVVAVPTGGRFRETEPWGQSYCRLPRAFDPAWIPADAAFATATFVVHPSGRGGCPVVAPVAAEAAANAPVCK